MTLRQSVLKLLYPLFIRFAKWKGRNKIIENRNAAVPVHSFFLLSIELCDGSKLNFTSLAGKKVLVVNTASNCGYTHQYSELQKLQEQYRNTLVIIGFPATDFKQQEKANDEEIASFCKINYGITFPLAKKSSVLSFSHLNPVFKWLTHKDLNGWNDQVPTWNFSKYLINETGILTHYFDPAISPFSKIILDALQE